MGKSKHVTGLLLPYVDDALDRNLFSNDVSIDRIVLLDGMWLTVPIFCATDENI